MSISYKLFDFLKSSSSQVKMVNDYKVHVVFEDIKRQLQENILTFFIIVFVKFSLN